MKQKQVKKTTAYIKRMISAKKWEVNSRTPTIGEIAKRNNVCWSTARKAMNVLEREGKVQNYGSIGFFVKNNLPDNITPLRSINLKSAKSNIKAAKLINNGGICIGRYVIGYIPVENKVRIIDLVTNTDEDIQLEDLLDSLKYPVKVNDLLKLQKRNEDEYTVARRKYEFQKRVKQVAKIVVRHKRNLGIHDR